MLVFNPSVLNKVVKTMTPQKERVEEAQIRGTIVFSANEHFVRLDGASGDSLTPIANFAEGASDAGFVHGDRVLVLIKNHQAIVTKNLTTGLQAQAAKEAGSFVTVITDEGITAQRIIANDTFTNTLRANEITADEIIAGMATIDQLDTNYAHITNGVIDNATIGHADVNDLDANYAHITSGVIDNATIGYADVNDLNANYAHITNGVIDNAKIGYADVDHLDAHYAEIDLANVNSAWIEYGAMKKAEVFDENVFDLSGDHATIRRIDASKINVANLRADNLIVRRINGQPVVGGYTLIDSNSSGYASKNPQALGWYEFVNAQWVLSTDTTVDMTKAYYQEGNEVSLYDQEYIDNLENGLQQQIDGAVETYTGTVVPTLVNWPYTDWYDTSVTPVHDERAKHVGDIYYVVNSAADENGYCYRFAYDNTQHAYDWVLIKDSDVTKALSDISDLQTFESETTSWIEETDEGLETIRTNHTTLSGKVDKTVKESIQLWFTKANTTAPNKPTAEVTSASTDGNAWRKVVPAYNASYPNYFYCWQFKFVDGTFGWSDVVRDIAMGETQGVSRDAKNTADAALPASTFTSFESTTFKDVKDTVTEHSTNFTNMTTRLGMNSDGTGANTDIVAKESALEQTVDGISTRVGKTETKLIGMYATSSTAAGTAAKVATITPTLPSGATWELGTGTIITVKFTNANTTSSPTLNVNSKGAKAIKTYANGNLSEAEYKWAAGSTFTFVYNGTNWLMQDSSVSVRMNSNETSISQTADSIISLASGSTTYTKPDGTTATSTIGTTVSQTANNVLIKATRTGATTAEQQAGGTSAAALINVTPDTVKIAANHVEIDGTAVFNAVSDSSTASAAMLNSEIEIGGRNLLVGTSKSQECTTQANQNWFSPSVYVLSAFANTAIADTNHTELTVSFDYSITGVDTAFSLYVAFPTSSDSYGASVIVASIPTGNSTGHSVGTIAITTAMRTYMPTRGVLLSGSGNANANAKITVSNFKLEFGNKATDWTLAPEDVQAEIDAKKSVHTLMSDNTSGASYSTILNNYAKEGTSVNYTISSSTPTTGIKIGDTVRLGYYVSDMGTAENRPVVYIVGTVTDVNSATNLTMIGHGLDTTIIDGGNILTNSIGANQIAANAITADELDTDSINNSGLLTTGALTVGAKADVLNSNIQVGGTNLLLNSKLRKSGSSNGVSFAASTLGSEYILINGTATATVDEYIADLQYLTAYAGCTVTISANFVPSGYIYVSTSKDGAWYKDYRQITWYNNAERRLTITLESGESLRYLRLHLDSGQTINASYRFKVEVGNKQTQWSPAPEDAEKSYYGSCETAAATAAKVVTCDGFTLKDGTIIGVRFTNGNTCTTAITLNVNGTGAKTVLLSGYSTGTAERFNLNLAAYATVSFVYDGTYWRIIGIDQTSTMITRIDNTGISIHPNGTSDHRAEITSSGMNIYKGGVSVAQYGDTARVGPEKNSYARTLINTGGMQVVQRSSSGTDITMANIGYGSGNAQSGTTTAPYYTLGTRKSGVAVGNYSLAAGVENEAVKYSSATIGEGLVSTNHMQTVVGRYNNRLLGGNSLFVVGDGTSDSSRSNAFEVEIGGDVIAKGGITVEGHSSKVGTTKTAYVSSNTSITAGTGAYLCSVSLEAGVWVITAVVQFPNQNNTTYRRLSITTASSGNDPVPSIQVAALSGYPTTLNATKIEYVSSTTTYRLAVLSGTAMTISSGSATTGLNYIEAVRIA